jgi:predicted transcriptional regulator
MTSVCFNAIEKYGSLERGHDACYDRAVDMSNLQEIRMAIAGLAERDKALLAAELFALNSEPDDVALDAALNRGLEDVAAGRVRPLEEVKALIPPWTTKS